MYLSKARLFRRDVTPLLDNRLLDLPGVGSGSGAHLLGDVNTLLSRFQFGDQFGDMFAGSLRFQGTLLLGFVLDLSLLFVVAHLLTLSESTASRSTQCNRFLGTASDWSELCDSFLRDRADLLGPLGTLGVGGVSTGHVLTLLLINCLTFDNIILNIVRLLFGPALRLILNRADLWSLNIAVLDERSSADLDSLGDGHCLVLDETVLPVVLVTLLLLL